jgi:acetyl esterase/lipase
MNRIPYIVCLFLMLMTYSNPAVSEPQEILLWPDGAPYSENQDPADQPTLIIYQPSSEKATGTAIVVCPGGGYTHLAMDHEGHQVAEWLNTIGVAAFVLKYRHNAPATNKNLHPVPFLDATRAIRTVRARAVEWQINPEHIGIMGFSAGGHLASTVGTHFDNGNPQSQDPIEKVTSRPNFMILIYPVISLKTRHVHRGSRRALLGENADLELVEKLSNETQVTSMTPPTFLVHADDDRGVPAENSLLFYQALRKAGVPAEMHIYKKGGHGFGMRKNDPILSTWINRLRDWLKTEGLVR